jgi:cation transport ATPase
MAVMEETQQRRPRLRRLEDVLGAWYTPLALGIAVLAWTLSGEVERFLAVLVVATPCPLLIAIPVAVIGAVSLSARRGIIIKNPALLVRYSQGLSYHSNVLFERGRATWFALCTPGRAARGKAVCHAGHAIS